MNVSDVCSAAAPEHGTHCLCQSCWLQHHSLHTSSVAMRAGSSEKPSLGAACVLAVLPTSHLLHVREADDPWPLSTLPPSGAPCVSAPRAVGLRGQCAHLQGRLVLELGAGCGLLGLLAAALGAHVMLTDLPCVLVSWSDASRRRSCAGRLRPWGDKCAGSFNLCGWLGVPAIRCFAAHQAVILPQIRLNVPDPDQAIDHACGSTPEKEAPPGPQLMEKLRSSCSMCNAARVTSPSACCRLPLQTTGILGLPHSKSDCSL